MDDGFHGALDHDLLSIVRTGLVFVRTLGAECRAELCSRTGALSERHGLIAERSSWDTITAHLLARDFGRLEDDRSDR